MKNLRKEKLVWVLSLMAMIMTHSAVSVSDVLTPLKEEIKNIMEEQTHIKKGGEKDKVVVSCPKELINGKCAYDIGDKGPAGGVVFYVTSAGEHGFEMAPENQVRYRDYNWREGQENVPIEWGCFGVMIPGSKSKGIGAGKWNTRAILDNCEGRDGRKTNAQIVDEYTLNGYSDWFIPSTGELVLMYKNLWEPRIYPFRFRMYVSSSEAIEDYHGTDKVSIYAYQSVEAIVFGDKKSEEMDITGTVKDAAQDTRAIREF
ncbi:hypothetical protein BMR03_11110 [Methylococcaceae bacterium HT2]|nr:hypothetical protein BMR03_11110 [Methylococcaceae bacterium HT2]